MLSLFSPGRTLSGTKHFPPSLGEGAPCSVYSLAPSERGCHHPPGPGGMWSRLGGAGNPGREVLGEEVTTTPWNKTAPK